MRRVVSSAAAAVCLIVTAGPGASARADVCCLPTGGCSPSCDFVCLPPAVCLVGGDCDDCLVQACCFGGLCEDISFVDCWVDGGDPQGPGVSCAQNPCGVPFEACCFKDGSCFDLTAADCAREGGAAQGAGSGCVLDPCPDPPEACCFEDGECLDLPAADCVGSGGQPQGSGMTCQEIECPAPCPAGDVAALQPPDGVVDARQPHPVDNAKLLQGIERLEVQAPAGAQPGCWSLCETDDGGWAPNGIDEVVDHGDDTYTVTLLRPITPGAVTTLSYDSGVVARYTFHPANVNADTSASPLDILSIIDCLNGVQRAENCPWGAYSEDLDHSALFGPGDLLTVIDLLNGADTHQPWNGTPLPENISCP